MPRVARFQGVNAAAKVDHREWLEGSTWVDALCVVVISPDGLLGMLLLGEARWRHRQYLGPRQAR